MPFAVWSVTVRPPGRRSPEIFTVASATGMTVLIEYRTGNRARIRRARSSGSQHHQDKRDEQLAPTGASRSSVYQVVDKRES